MAKSIESFLPDDRHLQTTQIRARIAPLLADEINKIRKTRRLRWDDVINACLKKFLDDCKLKEASTMKFNLYGSDEEHHSRWK